MQAPSSPEPGTSLTIGALRLELGTMEATDLVVETANGFTTASMKRLAIQSVRMRGPSVSLEMDRAVLTSVVARMARASGDGAAELLELAVESVELDGVQGMLDLPHRRASAAADVHLDALDELDGVLRAFVTDALWFVDASIKIPIADGRIDFNEVDVDHVGPDSTLGVDARGVHADAVAGRRIELVAFEGMPAAAVYGRAGGTGSGSGIDRGELELRPLVEALLKAPADAPVARVADTGLQGALQRTSITGELRLGNGALGAGSQQVVLTGREQGRNRIELSSPALGQRIVIRIAELAASSGALALAGKRVSTGALTGVVEAHVIGADPGGDRTLGTRRMALDVAHSRVEQLRIA